MDRWANYNGPWANRLPSNNCMSIEPVLLANGEWGYRRERLERTGLVWVGQGGFYEMNKQRLTAAFDLIGVLAERFPAAFAVNPPGYRQPLKLGIHNDIMAVLDGTITPQECATAMRVYCGNAAYLRACREGTARIDLNGNAGRQRQR